MTFNRRLVVDIGMSEGDDTDFYLRKGFDVVGVEADATLQDALRARFAAPLAEGRLRLLHRAASAGPGGTVTFWHDPGNQGHSRLAQGEAAPGVIAHQVRTIDWTELRAVAGVPYYLKMDIEGAEAGFIASMKGSPELPWYISSEMQTFAPAEAMHAVGYRHFRLINQTLWPHLTLPDPPREGVFADKPASSHWSGPFGRETPGQRWFSFEELRTLHAAVHRLWELGTIITGWMDCHACLPEALAAEAAAGG